MKTIERLQPTGDWVEVFDGTTMFHGPDGDSLLCGLCGSMDYVVTRLLDDGTAGLCVACLTCRRGVYKWNPTDVSCAAPNHNGPGSCGNVNCWKH